MSKKSQSKEKTHELETQNKIATKCSKRQRRKAPETWKQNVRKTLRQSGREYVSVNGKIVKEREMQPACGSTCHLSCSTKIEPNQRQLIHNTFWKLNDEQKMYFYWKYTTRIAPKRRRKTTINETRRGFSMKYRFEINGDMQYVCSKFFFATLDISPRRIYYFYEHCYDKEICMPRTNALLGKGMSRKTVLRQRLEEIRNHIKTYLNESKGISNNKLFLPTGVSLEKFQTHPEVRNETQRTIYAEEQNFSFNEISHVLEEPVLTSHSSPSTM
ncbi:uncharacterized protein LOC110118486 [Ceratitis capitata]|uniref:uncharacterized protein LOC110118486 n=1 Tax=Ceratitis capitata TaxID=7213 RepID=UPI000A10732D|nr:uncharacterized protein LOC110118486 [Ceratitis capitata]